MLRRQTTSQLGVHETFCNDAKTKQGRIKIHTAMSRHTKTVKMTQPMTNAYHWHVKNKCLHHVSLFPVDKPSFYHFSGKSIHHPLQLQLSQTSSHPTNQQQKNISQKLFWEFPSCLGFWSSFSIFSTGALGAKSVLSGAAPGLGGEFCGKFWESSRKKPGVENRTCLFSFIFQP